MTHAMTRRRETFTMCSLRAVVPLAFLALAACGNNRGNADGGSDGGMNPVGIGPEGGTVTGPDGAQAVIPAGALSSFVDIAITKAGASAPTFPPDGVTAVGDVYEFTPHGQTFAKPVSVRVPFDPAKVPMGESPLLYKAQPAGAYAALTGATVSGSFLETTVDGFSFFGGGVPNKPNYETFDLGQKLPTHLAPFPGGGVVAVGFGGGGVWVSRIAQNGTVEWTQTTQGELTLLTSDPRVAVGPTGNVYVAAATMRDEMDMDLGGRSEVRVMSYSPAGQARAGWPQRVSMNYTTFPAAIVADGQDNVHIYGTAASQNVQDNDSYRPWLATFSEAGAQRGKGFINFGGTAPSRRILAAGMALKPNGGSYLTARIVGTASVTDPGTGVHLLSLDGAGATVAGFPVRLSDDTPTHGAPVAVNITGVVYVLGNKLYAVNESGSAVSGFPKDVPTPAMGDYFYRSDYQPHLAMSAAGNLYVPGDVSRQPGNKGSADVFAQSLNGEGASRPGFPLAIGTASKDVPACLVVDAAGQNVWFLWYTDAASITARVSRFPAN